MALFAGLNCEIIVFMSSGLRSERERRAAQKIWFSSASLNGLFIKSIVTVKSN